MQIEYRDYKDIKEIIETNFNIYWIRIFHIVEDTETKNGIKIKKDNKADLKHLKELIMKWEAKIKNDSEEIKSDFSLTLFDEKNEERYEYQEFKDNIFAKQLWTVEGALRKATFDIEMEVYRDNFLRTSGADIFYAVKHILLQTQEYIRNDLPKCKYKDIKNVEQLNLGYLFDEEMLLPGVIGLGIRSEILHRLYPANFAIMTRRSLWGMYYITDEEQEFVIDESSNDNRRQRTSHNWEYEYDRFMYYSNFIANLLEDKLSKFDIKISSSIRFGYVNMFMNELYNLNKEKIDFLFKWRFVEV